MRLGWCVKEFKNRRKTELRHWSCWGTQLTCKNDGLHFYRTRSFKMSENMCSNTTINNSPRLVRLRKLNKLSRNACTKTHRVGTLVNQMDCRDWMDWLGMHVPWIITLDKCMVRTTVGLQMWLKSLVWRECIGARSQKCEIGLKNQPVCQGQYWQSDEQSPGVSRKWAEIHRSCSLVLTPSASLST